ncbi:MAG: hypothetical protein UT45_C0006G0095 [Candidatus Daviesbacteria bacterium GW2011_GWA2_39_33]|nr:MAG: hypothetical protein UT45_C0006G0095 [Candidatus Daviesbacteria bacterium GW2011_GWA2_39_33]
MPAPTVTKNASLSCIISGYDGSGFTISWSATTPDVSWVDISTSSSFTSYYHKAISPGATSTDGTLFNGYVGVSGPLKFSPGTTYYVRLYNGCAACARASTAFTSPTWCLPDSLSFSCGNSGSQVTFSWNAVAGADNYYVLVPYPGTQYTAGNVTSYVFPVTPGETYSSWAVQACKDGNCSGPVLGNSFSCPPAPCPGTGHTYANPSGSVGACGASFGVNPGEANQYTIGTCPAGKHWTRDPGPGLSYDKWCKTNVNSTRGYCHKCDPDTSAWIQIERGDVHSNTGINAPGGP